MIKKDIAIVLKQFGIDFQFVNIQRFGEGHIHETYLVETKNHQPDYILQKINHNIFKDIPGMMANIEAVTRHIRNKLDPSKGFEPDRQSLKLIYTRAGASFLKDEEGNYWRVYIFIPDTITYQLMSNPSLAREAGKAIGSFQALLADLQEPLIETILDFHNINLRIDQFQMAMEKNIGGRKSLVPGDILFVESRFTRMKEFLIDLKERGQVRSTHNDTKLNNILFDRKNRALCLIDLDTVMPGYVHFDYGDALRTMANTALEDEKDLSKVRFNKEVYDFFTDGYMEAAGDMLNDDERLLLPFSPVYMTFIIGLRFLTDYLNGDIYFQVHRPDHNLERARVQFKLVTGMEKSLNI